MTRIIIFDLDNTLFDTRSIDQSLTASVFREMRVANCGEDAVPNDLLDMAFSDSWAIPFPVVAAKYSLPRRLLDLWTQLHQKLEFPEPLTPYSDVIESLQKMKKLNRFLCLLTSGYLRVQLRKIEALGIDSYFDLILIDAADDEHLGKEKILANLLQQRGWQPSDVLIVGDSAISEIAAGVRLGIPTVQILRPGVIKTTTASRHIHSLTELI